MEHNKPRAQEATTAAWLTIPAVLLSLLLSTFLLCEEAVQQFLPMILPAAFALLVWLAARLRFVKRHGKLFLVIGAVFAIGVGVALHNLF